ncbi:hypothetical protein OE88DRAFT_1644993 [Heliocybe sulcata]|uniref:Uncharacterized protein n=1 Tax=Heliocybe sulcata TaxID=5364 RepID=A0A5C3N284_9AGAM|nr:hypothetical protein OE88DRAFT_1644993 [Heliocybe sulcata]
MHCINCGKWISLGERPTYAITPSRTISSGGSSEWLLLDLAVPRVLLLISDLPPVRPSDRVALAERKLKVVNGPQARAFAPRAMERAAPIPNRSPSSRQLVNSTAAAVSDTEEVGFIGSACKNSWAVAQILGAKLRVDFVKATAYGLIALYALPEKYGLCLRLPKETHQYPVI